MRHLSALVLLLIMLFLTGTTMCQDFFLPLFTYIPERTMGLAGVFYGSITDMMPLCGYGQVEALNKENMAEEIYKVQEETKYTSEKAVAKTEAEKIAVETESEGYGSMQSASGELPEEAQALEALTMEELLRRENKEAGGFVPAIKTAEYDWEALKDYETLLSAFYTIDANALAGSDLFNVENLNGRNLSIQKTSNGPQILIYHTHSRETYKDSVQGNPSQTIVGVGEFLAQILTEEYGYTVLHHTEEYDTVRDEAYAKSLPALKQILQDNPSIQVVIDLHRDSGNAKRNMVVDIGGRKTARFMFFNGISRSRKTGEIEYLSNPNREDNLAFSFQMQAKAGEYYPGLTRNIYIKQYRYNMHLRERTLLVELGDENNTLEEAKNACYPLAHLLDMVLSGKE